MCDEITEAENERWLAGHPLKRRDLGMIGAGAAAAMLMPACASGTTSTAEAKGVTSRMVSIATEDGTADAFFVYPESGRHPAVIMWPDIAGIRDASKQMGARLAAAGYAVLVVNQYYRSAPAPIVRSLSEWFDKEVQTRLAPMVAAITPEGTTRDAAAFIAWLDKQGEVESTKKIGTCGYCMGGPFTFRTAAINPDRVGALAAFHAGRLVGDSEDSPHRLIAGMKAALLVAIAQNDDEREPEVKNVLRAAAQAAGRPAEIEVYPAQHGWCALDAPVYDKEQAEKAWSRMLATFGQYL